MNTKRNYFRTNDTPTALCWAMRLTGLVLAAASVYLWTRDLMIGTMDNWFLGFSAALGVMLLVITWLPYPSASKEAETVLPLTPQKVKAH